MSAASQANIIAAAQVASAIAASLNANPNPALTPSSVAATLGSVLATVGPMVDPRLGLAVTLAELGFKAYEAAVSTGQGLTKEQWDLLIGADDAAIEADRVARVAAIAARTPQTPA